MRFRTVAPLFLIGYGRYDLHNPYYVHVLFSESLSQSIGRKYIVLPRTDGEVTDGLHLLMVG